MSGTLLGVLSSPLALESIADALRSLDVRVEEELKPLSFVASVQWLLYVFKLGLDLEGVSVVEAHVFYDDDSLRVLAVLVARERVFVIYAKPHITVKDVDDLTDLLEAVGEAYPDHTLIPVLASYTIDIDAERYAFSLDIHVLSLA